MGSEPEEKEEIDMAVTATGEGIDRATLKLLTVNRLAEGDYRFDEDVEFLDMTADEFLSKTVLVELHATLTPLTGDLDVLPIISAAREDQRRIGTLELKRYGKIGVKYSVVSPGTEPEFISISMPQFSGRIIRELIREALRLLGSYLATGLNPDPERVEIFSLPF